MNDFKKTKEDFVEKVRVLLPKFEKIEYSKARSKYEKKKARLLSSAVEQCSEGIAISDLQGNLLFVNEAFATIHGYTKEGLIGKHLSIFHTTEQMPSVDAANRQLQETGEFRATIFPA